MRSYIFIFNTAFSRIELILYKLFVVQVKHQHNRGSSASMPRAPSTSAARGLDDVANLLDSLKASGSKY